jgi:hypothetical protein
MTTLFQIRHSVLVEEEREHLDRLARLPRAWWFPDLKGFRSAARATYVRFDLDEQPRVNVAEDDLSWLEGQPEKSEWALNGPESTPDQPLTAEALEALAGQLPLPLALITLAHRADLQRRIRSATACYFDLGHFVVPTTVPDGHLLHLVSDQQSVRHWLLYLDRDGRHVMVTTAETLGFDYSDEPECAAAQAQSVRLDGTNDLEVCADTLTEFLYRFWVENELWFALLDQRPLTGAVQRYAQRLPPAGGTT